jgi:hypothetical protein
MQLKNNIDRRQKKANVNGHGEVNKLAFSGALSIENNTRFKILGLSNIFFLPFFCLK